MRNLHYERAHRCFGAIQEQVRSDAEAAREVIARLEDFLKQLELANLYAEDAVRGLKRNKLRKYRHDKNLGVLEEEIVLCYFLEEMISSTQFLRKRLKTDLKMRVYRERIQRFQAQTPGEEGFLARILESLDAMAQTEFIEIGKLISIMDERYRIGNNLFAIIMDKAIFSASM